jgi:hypothetical protein
MFTAELQRSGGKSLRSELKMKFWLRKICNYPILTEQTLDWFLYGQGRGDLRLRKIPLSNRTRMDASNLEIEGSMGNEIS